MARITFALHGTKEVRAALDRLGADAPKAAGQAMNLEAERIMAASKKLVPVDMGPLRASGHVEPPSINGTHVRVRLGYGGAAGKYALYVHEGTGPAVGRKPFMPPASAFAGWAQRHGMAGKEFLIARAVGRRGLKPTKFLEKPFIEAQRGMERRVASRLGAWLAAHAGRKTA